MIPIYQPYLPKESLKYAHDAIDSGWISSQGQYKDMVEDKLKSLLSIDYVLLLNNGTSAVHLMSRALTHHYKNIKNIIVPNNAYVAAWNGFIFDKKLKLLPIDADINTWNMDVDLIDGYDDNTTAILVVHNVGGTVNVPALIRKHPQVTVLEDACEGFLGKYEGDYVGTASVCSALSFFGNKNITCGEGGALITNDKDIYDFAKKLQGQGQSDIRYIHDELGYNYRMTNIQAALLYGQLECLDKIMEKKKKIFDYYREVLPTIPHVVLQKTDIETESSNWMMGVRIAENKKGYSHVEDHFRTNGVDIRPMFYPMTKHKHLKGISNRSYEHVANILSKECFMVPSYPELKDADLEKIYSTLKCYVKKYIDKE